ncbi:unnamed protein product, partial [Meganyctiphanes norvegica]
CSERHQAVVFFPVRIDWSSTKSSTPLTRNRAHHGCRSKESEDWHIQALLTSWQLQRDYKASRHWCEDHRWPQHRLIGVKPSGGRSIALGVKPTGGRSIALSVKPTVGRSITY